MLRFKLIVDLVSTALQVADQLEVHKHVVDLLWAVLCKLDSYFFIVFMFWLFDVGRLCSTYRPIDPDTNCSHSPYSAYSVGRSFLGRRPL